MASANISHPGESTPRKNSSPTASKTRNRLLPKFKAGENAWQDVLHASFGLGQLRPGQQEVIESVLQGRDTLAIMPSGAGKSLCYQLPALKLPGMTIVVSPLISLMKDQAAKLGSVGISATEVNSTLSAQTEESALQHIRHADQEFVFATPERMSDPEFLKTLKQSKISLFVIDEAHCISHWGHDFRPAYLQLGAAIEALGNPIVLALTATATDAVIADIGKQLGLPDMHVINTGIYRPNLHYRVIASIDEAEKLTQLRHLVHETPGSGIVYTATVKSAEEIHQALQNTGESVTLYHGHLSAKVREHHQDMFMSGSSRIMVATNAFGMGIDKRDIRFVVHYQLPSNLEAYYQESGRAGRDGSAATCTLLYYLKDKQIQQFFLARRYPRAEDLNTVYTALQELAAENSHIPFSNLQNKLEQIADSKLRIMLKLLKDGGLIMQDENLDYGLLKRQAKPRELKKLVETYHDKSARDHEALEHMVFYAQTGFCRWKVLLEYFGEHVDWNHCGTCDNCLRPPEQALSPEHVRLKIPKTSPASKELTLEAGKAVTVAKFGEGRVLSSAGEKVTIQFPSGEAKTFLRSYVKPVA